MSDDAPEVVRQCATCPWKVTTVPDRDIPHGYRVQMHRELKKTIQTGLDSLFRSCRTGMACHYSKIGEEFPCAGWLHHQIGEGNNLGVRLAVATGRLPVPEVEGEQHERFEDTLPKSSLPKASRKRQRKPR